jgi:hypothetical protein
MSENFVGHDAEFRRAMAAHRAPKIIESQRIEHPVYAAFEDCEDKPLDAAIIRSIDRELSDAWDLSATAAHATTDDDGTLSDPLDDALEAAYRMFGF